MFGAVVAFDVALLRASTLDTCFNPSFQGAHRRIDARRTRNFALTAVLEANHIVERDALRVRRLSHPVWTGFDWRRVHATGSISRQSEMPVGAGLPANWPASHRQFIREQARSHRQARYEAYFGPADAHPRSTDQ